MKKTSVCYTRNTYKMSLLDLPEEVFIIIVKKLDLKSLCNLYSTCQYARNILQIRNLVKEWHMSRCSIASVKYLKSDFFKNVASQLTVLNLCGVTDLCKTALLPALKRSKTLITLDVSYTDIDLVDFCDMYKVCPSIKNICINFEFDKTVLKNNKALVETYQDIFKNMENIHFVGSCVNLLFSNTVLHLLTKSSLNILKLTVAHRKTTFPIISDEQFTGAVKFNEFYVYFMNLEANFGNYYFISIFQAITRVNYEIIIIINGEYLYEMEVYASPVFKDFFKDKFDMNIRDLEEYDYFLIGNMAVMIFNKETVNFNTALFKRLFIKLKGYFPYVIDSVQQEPVPDTFDWFYARPVVTMEPKSSSNSFEFKKKRIANPNFTLNYDTTFKNKYRAELSLSFSVNYVNPMALSPNTEFLSKLTFLSLSGTVRYSVEFFNVLFRCCSCLVTLDVLAPSISPCFQPICRSIPLSQTLKNLRLIDRNIDFRTFFNSLSQCKSLENIHILDQSSESTTLADPNTLFESCENLYNICINANMTDTCKRKMVRLFNDAKKARNKPQINVLLCQITQILTNDRFALNYEPSISVFNIFPIKPDHSFN